MGGQDLSPRTCLINLLKNNIFLRKLKVWCWLHAFCTMKMLGKNPNPLYVYVWIKINDYRTIAILWKQKKFSKHHTTTTQEHQILRGKPSSVEGKTTGQLRKISTINRDYNYQVYAKLVFTINWIYNKLISRSKYNLTTKPVAKSSFEYSNSPWL